MKSPHVGGLRDRSTQRLPKCAVCRRSTHPHRVHGVFVLRSRWGGNVNVMCVPDVICVPRLNVLVYDHSIGRWWGLWGGLRSYMSLGSCFSAALKVGELPSATIGSVDAYISSKFFFYHLV